MIEQVRSTELFFYESLQKVLKSNHIKITDMTESYLVQLLSDLTKPQYVTISREDNTLVDMIKTIVTKYGLEKANLLRELADYTLIWSGVFREQLSHKKINLSYYQEVGTTAYLQAGSLHKTFKAEPLGSICKELGNVFMRLSDVLVEVITLGLDQSDKGLVNIADRFQKSGTLWMKEVLVKNGLTELN